jgi:glycosyltransferase involved in cell wall biosynthesis
MSQKTLSYVLITPARNEEAFIELTIQSMVGQTVRPLKWVIVSDGSTDRTEEIVKQYLPVHPWIELVRMPERKERHFGGKVLCFNAGLARVRSLNYDVLGNLDADMSFESGVFAFLLEQFAGNPKLGVAGAPFSEGKGTYDFRFSSLEHVSGACQLFRRECFEAIGGYLPIKGGGIDVVAVLTARMKGWQTRTFPENVCMHHRAMGTGSHRASATAFRLGEKDYTLGRGLVWQLFRSLYQMTRRPVFVGGASLLAGYLWSMLRRVERPVSKDLIDFQRQEHLRRLKRFFLRSKPSRAHSDTASTEHGGIGVRPSPGAAALERNRAAREPSHAGPLRGIAAPGDGRTPGAVCGCAQPSPAPRVPVDGNEALQTDAVKAQ